MSADNKRTVRVVFIVIACALLLFGGTVWFNGLFFRHEISNTKVAKEAEQIESPICYITSTGGKYHSSGCQYLRSSKIETTLYQAKKRGYSKCSRCRGSQAETKTVDIPKETLYEETVIHNYYGAAFVLALSVGGLIVSGVLLYKANEKMKLAAFLGNNQGE